MAKAAKGKESGQEKKPEKKEEPKEAKPTKGTKSEKSSDAKVEKSETKAETKPDTKGEGKGKTAKSDETSKGDAPKTETKEAPKGEKKKGPPANYKRRTLRRAAMALVDRNKKYTLPEASALVKQTAFAKFKEGESVDLAVRLGVNPKHADQMVRGAIVLPHGTGQTLRVLVFAKGEKITEAKNAGADFVGSEDMVQKVQEGFLDFDRVIATPDMMGVVGKLGRILGPRGLMPNPKVGTVTFDVTNAIKEAKAGKVEYRVDKAGIVHARIGKSNFNEKSIEENALSLIQALIRAKPSTAKGTYLRSITMSSTMGPGIRIDTLSVVSKEEG